MTQNQRQSDESTQIDRYAGQRSWPVRLASLPAPERVPDEPDHRGPEAHEQRTPFGISALILIDGLGADPQADAKPDRAQRQGLQVPGPKPGVVEALRQHLSR
jgi:hypothetical protein